MEFFELPEYRNGVHLSKFFSLFYRQFGYFPCRSITESLRKINIFAFDFIHDVSKVESLKKMDFEMNCNYDLYLCKIESRNKEELKTFCYPCDQINNGIILDGLNIHTSCNDIEKLLTSHFGKCLVKRRGAHRFVVWFDSKENGNKALNELKNNQEGVFIVPQTSFDYLESNILSWMDCKHVYNL